MKYMAVVVVLVALAVSITSGRAGPVSTGGEGMELYVAQCAACHGEEGRGDGLAAEYLYPRPRDFTKGAFKLRSTASGDMPTDGDILQTLTRGIPGSGMPSFEFLSDEQRKLLVGVVKALTVYEGEGEKYNIFEDAGEPRVIEVPEAPAATPELAARGRQVYEEMQCAKCHGDAGEGDGPSAPTLLDSWDMPIPPANFARGIFKGGDSLSDIYFRFTTGMDGTPMPSYEDSLPVEDRWALSIYVKSLVRKDQKTLVHTAKQPVRAGKAAGEVPLDPDAEEWSGAPATEVPLMTLWQRQEAPNYVTLRALSSATHVGVLLEWPDDTVNSAVIRPQDYSDAAAVMFASTKPEGHFTMGEKGKPVNIWQWRFSRQLDIARFADMESAYPGMAADDYQSARSHYPKTGDFPGHLPVSSAPEHDPTYVTGWGAGSGLSNPSPASAVEDLNAEGFGTLEPQPASDQNVEGQGIWKAGRWKVVFRRPLETAGADAPLAAGEEAHVAFAVWDGDKGDRNGKKSVTFWQILKLE